MSSKMRVTRLVELSIIYMLQEELSVKRSGESPKSTDSKVYTLKNGTLSTTRDVVVKVDGEVVNQGYRIDYVNGLVIFDTSLDVDSVVKVDYYYCPVNIYDEGINITTDKFKYPAIALYEDYTDTEPIELGTSKKDRVMRWVIEVCTERGGERNDIKDTIIDLFEEDLKIFDYNTAFPTTRNGDKNPDFNESSQAIGYAICSSINSSNGGSLDIGDKPKYLSEIYIELKVSV